MNGQKLSNKNMEKNFVRQKERIAEELKKNRKRKKWKNCSHKSKDTE